MMKKYYLVSHAFISSAGLNIGRTMIWLPNKIDTYSDIEEIELFIRDIIIKNDPTINNLTMLSFTEINKNIYDGYTKSNCKKSGVVK